jgi:metal-responsive CopG/Arc/MetJ family transcriptional regulator
MKTAISIPDDVFEEADLLAQQTGVSRSELYVAALRAYLDASRDDRVTERLNSVYDADVSDHDQFLTRAAAALARATQA